MFDAPYGWIMTGGLFFVLALVVLLSSPIVIDGYYRRSGNKDDAQFTVKLLYGLIKYRVKVPFVRFTGKSLQLKEHISTSSAGQSDSHKQNDEIDAERVVRMIDKWKQLLEMTRDFTGVVKHALERVDVHRWQWSTSVGTGDAMWTAMATGLVWSIKTSAIGLLSQVVRLKSHPELKVDPVYDRPAFTTEWSCIAQIRFGYAILAGLQLFIRMKKWKGGVKLWQNILFKA
ncbi:DUF2953 domain-containing protein [Paenibacillus sp. CAU 1782]